MENKHFKIVIVGGGTAGITVAAQLKNKDKKLEIAIIEPSEKHYYQPAFTLVGAGTYKMQNTIRQEKTLIPKGVTWIKDAALELEPDEQYVKLNSGQFVKYDYLVVAAGIQYNWDAIPGLRDAIGKNGVTSNYEGKLAPYTWQLLQDFKGGNAIFTQPSTPIKCGGAPQKIMYLAEDYFRKHGKRNKANVIFATPGSTIFGVEPWKHTLQEIVKERNIKPFYFYNLVEVRGDKKEVVFEITNLGDSALGPEDLNQNLGMRHDTENRVVIPYEILHLAPPQSAPDFIKRSKLAVKDSPYGWVDVDKHTLQHKVYPNVFALGDVSSTPNAKTGAAVRKQAPVLVKNLLAVMAQHQDELAANPKYTGYGSCPLVTRYGRMVLAEFDYDNKPMPSFPFDTSKERYSMWILKKYILPWFYWHRMLKGKG